MVIPREERDRAERKSECEDGTPSLLERLVNKSFLENRDAWPWADLGLVPQTVKEEIRT